MIYGLLTNRNYEGLGIGVRVEDDIHTGVEGPGVCSIASYGEASGPLQTVTMDVCCNRKGKS